MTPLTSFSALLDLCTFAQSRLNQRVEHPDPSLEVPQEMPRLFPVQRDDHQRV